LVAVATRSVVDPKGRRWTVRRRWLRRLPRWRGDRRWPLHLLHGSTMAAEGADLPGVGVVFVVIALALVVVALLMLILPVLAFAAELLVMAALIGLGFLGRTLLRRPWTVEARCEGADHAFEWQVSGWRASTERCESVAQLVEATGEPSGGARVAGAP